MNDLAMTRTGVVVVWNAPLKPNHGLRKVRILAGPELTKKHDEFLIDWSSPEWENLRKLVLGRDNYICRNCATRFAEYELTVHHIVPRRDGGNERLSNIITLCDTCHDIIEYES